MTVRRLIPGRDGRRDVTVIDFESERERRAEEKAQGKTSAWAAQAKESRERSDSRDGGRAVMRL